MADAPPFFSLILGVDAVDREGVARTVRSVQDQSESSWELVLHGDGAEAAVEEFASGDARIRSVRAAGNPAVRVREVIRGVEGEFTAFLDSGDTLVGRDSLASVRTVAEPAPQLDLAYSDEVLVLDERGAERLTVTKPFWSPERLRVHSWVGRLLVIRSVLAREACRVGELGDNWEHDLLLRIADRAHRVERIPEVLYESWSNRPGLPRTAEPGALAQVARADRDDPSVAAVIPCTGARGLAWGERRGFVVEAVRTLLRHAGTARLEVVVVHTSSVDPSVLYALLGLGESVRLVSYSGAYNYPAMVDLGVLSTAAEVVIAMNEHTEVASDDFVHTLVGPLGDERVGLTGPRVLFSNGTLVDAGLALHQHHVQPMFAGALATEPGPDGLLTLRHECSALNGTCLALRRETFDRLGGLSVHFPVLFHVDISFKMRHLGLRRLWVPGATAYDLSGRHEVLRPAKSERQAMRGRWLAPDLDEYAPTFGAWHAERDRRLLAGAPVDERR